MEARTLEPVILALGSNLGDRRNAFNRAIRFLTASGVHTVHRSQLLMTHPLGGADQGWYLNAVIIARTRLAPTDLLRTCQTVERRMGRIRRAKWEPRIIDIDLIAYPGCRLDSPGLRLPHIGWEERDFVLYPLLELGIWPAGKDGKRASRWQIKQSLLQSERCIFSVAPWPKVAP